MSYNLDSLRHIEGFPIGSDEDILALSDPPHYTAYPNPHIAEFIAQWGKPYDEATDSYHREPYVADVSEGKNDPIYNAHTYHTKVPYKAIIPFIEHYTEPGNIVFDGFCGTGMTGVAAQMVGRRAILCDLSPAATFLAYNFNTPLLVDEFEQEAKRVILEIERECSWMYETEHKDRNAGYINHVVWSDVFLCPYCGGEIIFWDAAVDQDAGRVNDSFACPSCSAELSKDDLKRKTERTYDDSIGISVEKACTVPVKINYSVGTQRFDKRPDAQDLDLINRISSSQIPYWYPTTRIDRDIDIWYERDYRQLGVYSVDAFFTKRNLWCTASQWSHAWQLHNPRVRSATIFALTGNIGNVSKMNRWPRLRGPLTGTLYIPSIFYEINPLTAFRRRIEGLVKVFRQLDGEPNLCTLGTQSVSDLSGFPSSSCDYIFTDPPFGSNIIP